MKESFVFYETWAEVIRHMPDKERLQIFDAIMSYGIYGEKTELGGLAQMALNLVFNDIDECKAKRTERAEKNRSNILKRWEKAHSNGNERIQSNTNVYERIQSDTKHSVDGDVDVNVNVNGDNKRVDADKSATRQTELFNVETVKKETKHKYGEYKNVLLTEDEFGTLNAKYGKEAAAIIDNYSQYKEMKGYKCKRDYLAILKWGVSAYRESQNRKTAHRIDTSERDNRNIDGIW